MKILNIKDHVRELLEEFPILRDDDNKLILIIWENELPPDKWLVFHYWFGEGKLTTPEAITRCRRKLQEENVSLRGKNYLKRHKEQEKVVEELGDPNWRHPTDEEMRTLDDDTLTGQVSLDL